MLVQPTRFAQIRSTHTILYNVFPRLHYEQYSHSAMYNKQDAWLVVLTV